MSCHPEPCSLLRRWEPPREEPALSEVEGTYVLCPHHGEPFQDFVHGRHKQSCATGAEHKTGTGSDFTTKYKLDRLVYFERFEDVHKAIEREKRIKGWSRIKKIALIVSVNPSWKDLSEEWYERHQYQPPAAPPKRPPAANSTA